MKKLVVLALLLSAFGSTLHAQANQPQQRPNAQRRGASTGVSAGAVAVGVGVVVVAAAIAIAASNSGSSHSHSSD